MLVVFESQSISEDFSPKTPLLLETFINWHFNGPFLHIQVKKKTAMALSGFVDFFQKGKTFRPKKKFQPGTLRYSLHKQAQASLSSGINLRTAVQLPPGEDANDWMAVHVVDFFNRINLIYGTVSDQCTAETCPTMSGGPRYEYLWADGNKYKKPTALPAPQYVALLMDWIEMHINDESLFPVTTSVPFPKNFLSTCKKILTRLFRVFVHVYIHHFDRIVAIGAEPHVNTCYKHFFYFVQEFKLIGEKELEPLREMTRMVCKDASGQSNLSGSTASPGPAASAVPEEAR
ncbi:MOB kinase activator-like 3 isoform X2 [Neocloeon triangulifer]|uniref:MOB kinase activator-like 3 isoform X2 n=2 Tax=Neocloeon triangulifer TaxID=2078957 RepID=UPI00286F6FEE|nr:MOB kinase activator-like 3 isoform X2 [Neocloeon triangulifer]